MLKIHGIKLGDTKRKKVIIMTQINLVQYDIHPICTKVILQTTHGKIPQYPFF